MPERGNSSGSDPFDLENEGEIIQNPSFVCDLCGFANVRLVDMDGAAAAKCTNCGVAYMDTDRSGDSNE